MQKYGSVLARNAAEHNLIFSLCAAGVAPDTSYAVLTGEDFECIDFGVKFGVFAIECGWGEAGAEGGKVNCLGEQSQRKGKNCK